MKKIGFVDYYLSEWHANHYPEWITAADKMLGTDYSVAYGWAELDTSPVDGRSTDEWCREYGVTRCNTVEELCEKSDAIIILAPSDPDKHLGYAQKVLPYGKPTYIDKTFAPDLAAAKEIFVMAEKYKTPFFSTSALRYASELNDFCDISKLFLTGGGGNFNEYIIHTVEMAVTLLNDRVEKVCVECLGRSRLCRAVTEGKTDIVIQYSPALPFSVMAESSDGKCRFKEVRSDTFSFLISDILRFFETGKVPFDPMQTIEAMRFRDALLKAETNGGSWITVTGTK